MEQLNHLLFTLINATPTSNFKVIIFAIILARYVIFIIPLSLIAIWLWGTANNIVLQRQLVVKTATALVFSMLFSIFISQLLPHKRPFVEDFGYIFLVHVPDSSFPSNHGSAIFTFALAFLFWHRLWSGMSLIIIALAIAWSRIYLGIHWPLDMLGAFFIGLIGCLLSQVIWYLLGNCITQYLFNIYHLYFAFPIRKGWIKV
ncbi:undecaprenyl-diphosphate phosphatase [Candidatus Fukatsuia anoeciicola]|uniref:undecaprenyl-diphosphate phosphatase n=1 Tax=Candidatus Fukatsuia anoeciicola TaxID=2994492 RepID=UPI003463E053